MATTPGILSGSTNGKAIAVGTSATAIHTTTTDKEQPTLFASNPSASVITLTITEAATDIAKIELQPRRGFVPILEDCIYSGAAVALTAKTDAGTVYIKGKNLVEA